MTVLPEGRDFLVCQDQSDATASWVPVIAPFPPNGKWLTYGPEITLHGEGFRNPNLSSGQWTATPQGPADTCTEQQVTVVRAGVLAPPEVFQGEPGQPLSFDVLPKLFSIQLTGNCLWTRTTDVGFGW